MRAYESWHNLGLHLPPHSPSLCRGTLSVKVSAPTVTSAWNTGSPTAVLLAPSHPLGFSPNITSSERPLWPHNLNDILFIGSPIFFLQHTCCVTVFHFHFYFFFKLVHCLFPVHAGGKHTCFIHYSGPKPSQGLAYSKLPINVNQFLVTV